VNPGTRTGVKMVKFLSLSPLRLSFSFSRPELSSFVVFVYSVPPGTDSPELSPFLDPVAQFVFPLAVHPGVFSPNVLRDQVTEVTYPVHTL